MNYQEQIINHYKTSWAASLQIYHWDKGPANALPYDFRILEFSPSDQRKMWTYATCCMSQDDDERKIELHLFSSIQDNSIVELLTMIAHYHRTTARLGLNHTVNFGRSWQSTSKCNYGLISLPYLDGPDLEDMSLVDSTVKFYWLIPITEEEVKYKKKMGAEALEQKFEDNQLDYINPNRKSVLDSERMN